MGELHDDLREAFEEIPGMRVMCEAETIHFLDQMKAAHDAQPDEPVDLPLAPIDFIPTGLWDDDVPDPLRLLTLDEYARVPDGAMLVSIGGKAKIKGRDEIDEDIRFGCMAWGFRDSQLRN